MRMNFNRIHNLKIKATIDVSDPRTIAAVEKAAEKLKKPITATDTHGAFSSTCADARTISKSSTRPIPKSTNAGGAWKPTTQSARLERRPPIESWAMASENLGAVGYSPSENAGHSSSNVRDQSSPAFANSNERIVNEHPFRQQHDRREVSMIGNNIMTRVTSTEISNCEIRLRAQLAAAEKYYQRFTDDHYAEMEKPMTQAAFRQNNRRLEECDDFSRI